LADGVEVWLQSLSESAAKTIKELNVNIIQDCNAGVVMDEWFALIAPVFVYNIHFLLSK
jgi:hypothetical protein